MLELDNITGKVILQMSDKDLLVFLDAFYNKIKESNDIKQDEWIDAETAKSILKVATTTLYKLRSNNEITITQFGKTILYSRTSINEFLSRNIKTIS